MTDVADVATSALLVPSVQVDVLEECEETGTATPGGTTPHRPFESPGVLQCCREAANSILQTPNPINVQYEQYTAAIGHVTWHWPTSETVSDVTELESKLISYHSLRAELYTIFRQAFPLTEDMYVQWISDCRTKGATIEELKRLFELSQADYWSVSLTLQYLAFLKEHGDKEELKVAMNKAQQTVGLHFTRGHEIWALCREYVTEAYEDADEKCELEKERTVRELFCRQMRVPLDQNDLAMSEFRAWNAYNARDAEVVTATFTEALERQTKVFAPLMKKLRGFEAKVNAIDDPEQDWQRYLNFVKHRVAPLVGGEDKGKQLVVCLYERALSVLCLSSKVWLSYIEYVESEAKIAVARRAVRNVPFDSAIWTALLIEMEHQNTDFDEISHLIQKELVVRSHSPMSEAHLLSTLLSWCDSARRRVTGSISTDLSFEDTVQRLETQVDQVFAECQQLIGRMFPDYVEGRIRLAEYLGKCYWTLLSMNGVPDMRVVTKVNELWLDTLNTPLGDHAATWIAYLNALQRVNILSVESIRTMIFDEAVQRVKKSPLAFAESWLVFERENGDLTNYLRARQYHWKQCASAQSTAALDDAVVLTFGQDKPTQNAKKRKAVAIKQSKMGQKPRPAKHAKVCTPKSEKHDVLTASKSVEKKKQYESLTNEHTLFLCNVAKDASKGDLEDLFREIPTLKDVRLVVKTRGDRVMSRGMAYVQFEDDEGVQAGLRRNGFLLHGHPLRIERSKPPMVSASTAINSKGPSFWKSDPLTLYVGYLNREGSKKQVTEEELQMALQQSMQTAGGLVVVTRVSILKDRHGKWKNYGLVEVAKASQVAFCLANVAALQATLGDQVTMTPSRFSIAHILEQQEKQHKQKVERSKITQGPQARPTTRLAVASTTSLMPRALRRKPKVSTKASETSATAVIAPKTNADFRRLLFDK